MLPTIAFRRTPPTAVGVPVSLRLAIGEALHNALPPAAVKALDGLATEIETEVLDPLLYAETTHLAKTFERLYPKFFNLYVAATVTLLAALEEDPERLLALATRGFEEFQSVLRERGPRLVGQDATLAALVGLHMMRRVAGGAVRLLEQERVEAAQLDEDVVKEWTAWTIAHAMASFVVSSALSGEKGIRGRPANVAQLAYWSKGYAVRVYGLTKRLGLLRPAAPVYPIPESSDEEDLLLAEAGLNDYRELLEKEDEESGPGPTG